MEITWGDIALGVVIVVVGCFIAGFIDEALADWKRRCKKAKRDKES